MSDWSLPHTAEEPEEKQEERVRDPESRRRFLARATMALGGLLTAAAALPIVGLILTPALKNRQREGWSTLGRLDQFPEDRIVPAYYESVGGDAWLKESSRKTVWVKRTGDLITVFSSTCTHGGCRVAWRADSHQFLCPCHGGVYDSDGRVVAGPPPRPLTRCEVRVDSGTVLVREA